MARAEKRAGLYTSTIHLSRVTVTANTGTSILQGRTEREESICVQAPRQLRETGGRGPQSSPVLLTQMAAGAWADQNKYRLPCVK